jgi:hypothetical protein
MIRFMAIKVHYDHRRSLPTELKYSKAVTESEHAEYLRLHEEGIGGEGFHECLNYFIPENGPVRMYLPPTCIPGENTINDDFLIFSFTYGGDQEMPSRIIGVHGEAHLLNRKGLVRPEPNEIQLSYHIEADADFVTLFPSPLRYNLGAGRYTPRYQRWGFGLRYIEKTHAKNIILDQLRTVESELASNLDESRGAVLEREVVVLNRIYDRYMSGAVGKSGLAQENNKPIGGVTNFSAPDKELGDLGEKHIYERELAIVSKFGQPESQVKWVSRGNPQSPFDIRSIRELEGIVRDHYIEVKSTTVHDDTHIFVSAREIAFLDEHKDHCSVVLVRFNRDKSVKDVRDFTVDQLRERFELVPISFKLRPLA